MSRAGLWIAVAVLAAGCSEPSEPAWFIARFGSEERQWRRGQGRHIEPQRRPGMLIYELTQFPEGNASPAQRAAAEALRERCFLSAAQHGWYDYEVAYRDGYRLFFNDDAHYVNEEYLFDDGLLDPNRPEFLMYYDTSRGKRLVGFMFYVMNAEDHGPQIGGPLTTWHFHVWSQPQCLVRGLLAVGVPNRDGECARGEPTHRSPEMLHVWLLEHPEGPFATRMRIQPDLLERLVEERGF